MAAVDAAMGRAEIKRICQGPGVVQSTQKATSIVFSR